MKTIGVGVDYEFVVVMITIFLDQGPSVSGGGSSIGSSSSCKAQT